MKLFDIAKGLLKSIAPGIPKVTHHKSARIPTSQETQVKRPAPMPETHSRRATSAPTPEAPARRITHPAPKPAPRSRVTTGSEEYIRKGRPKKQPPERIERKSAPDNPIKKQVKKWWDKLKPGEVKPKKEREQKPRPTKRKPTPAPQPPKPKGRPKGAKDKKPRKPRETVTPRNWGEWGVVEFPPKPPTELVENEEPAKGELNVIEYLREQASWADNTYTVALLMREIEDAIDREGFGEFCERITVDAISADVEFAFYSSDAEEVYIGAMSLAALIGFNLNEDELFQAFVDDALKNIDRVFGIKAFI